MSAIVNPAVGMVDTYSFYKAQDYFYRMLVALRDAQNVITPAFTYDIVKNKAETYVAEEAKHGMVNIMIGNVGSRQETIHGKEHTAKLIFELYWKSKDDSGSSLKADELALEYLYYLAAQVEYELTAIKNQNLDNVNYGDFQIGKITTNFSKPEKIGKSESVWGLGQIELDIVTAYDYKDVSLPNLEELQANLGYFVPLFTPNPAP